MMYITLKDNRIANIYSSILPPSKDSIQVPASFQGVVGMHRDEMRDDWSIKTLEERKDYITVPKGYKIEGDSFVEMTQAEKYRAGVEPIHEGMKLEGDELIAMTDEEKLAVGLITLEDIKEKERQAILSQLDAIDKKSIRALRANETERLAELEAEAEELRAKLKE